MDNRNERYKTDPNFKARRLEENSKWRRSHSEQNKKIQAEYHQKNKEKRYQQTREWLKKHPEKEVEYSRRQRSKIREKVLDHYGRKCACCGVDIVEFLCIDHINGDGNKHRKSIGKRVGATGTYSWLIKNNFPPGFQTLCFNCNMAKHIYKKCPHQA